MSSRGDFGLSTDELFETLGQVEQLEIRLHLRGEMYIGYVVTLLGDEMVAVESKLDAAPLFCHMQQLRRHWNYAGCF